MRTRPLVLVALLAACKPDTGIKIYNSTPEASIVSHVDGATVDAGVSIELLGVVNDSNDDPDTLEVTWYDGSTTLCAASAPDADGFSTCVTSLDEGERSIVLEVRDPEGASGTARVELTATAPEVVNTAPTCAITAPEDGARSVLGELVQVVGVAADGETAAPSLSVLWSSDLDGVLDSTAADDEGNLGFSLSTLSVGAHQLSLLVSDPEGERCEDAVTLYVGDVPSVEITAPEDGDRFGEGEAISFAATVSSGTTAAEDLALVWESDVDGELDTSAADADGAAGFVIDALTPGAHTITLTAEDGFGLIGGDSVSVVINGQPTAPVVSVSPDPASPSEDLVASVDTDSVDPEGAAVSYSYAWTVNGADAGIEDATVPASATSDGEVWTVTVTPNDGEIDGPAATASATVGNAAPVLSDVTLSPDPAYEGDTLSCTPGSATDVDGDSISYGYAWTVNGGTIASTADTLSSSSFDKGDDVRCTVTPTDGTTAGAAVESNTVTISNSAPAVSGVSISPSSPTASSTLSCSWTFSDGDGDSDASTVVWTVNGSSVGTGTSLSGSFGSGDSVSCTVTPNDGTDAGTAASATVSIGNTAPSLASASLSPTTAYEGDTLSCTPDTATDADGDTVSYTYAWTVSGASVGVTSTTLSSSYFGRGDAVRCAVTPYDGTDYGTAVASNTVTISNTAPTISGVSISPSTATASSTLSATYSTSDADSDTVSVSYVWTVNGTAVSTSSTLSGTTYFNRGDVVQVSVTPTDGSASGTAGTASVTLANSAPGAPDIAIDPEYAEAGTDELLCYAITDATDADGDTLTYNVSWEVDGLPYPGGVSGAVGPDTTEWTDDTVPAADTDLGSSWTCTVTADDGADEGAEATATAETLAFYEVGYYTSTGTTGSVAPSYVLGHAVTVSTPTTLYKLGSIVSTVGVTGRLAVYTDSGGSPATLVAYTSTFVTETGAQEIDVVTPATLSAGTYWVVGSWSSIFYAYFGSTSSVTIKYKSGFYSSTPSSSFGTAASYSGRPLALYLVVAD